MEPEDEELDNSIEIRGELFDNDYDDVVPEREVDEEDYEGNQFGFIK